MHMTPLVQSLRISHQCSHGVRRCREWTVFWNSAGPIQSDWMLDSSSGCLTESVCGRASREDEGGSFDNKLSVDYQLPSHIFMRQGKVISRLLFRLNEYPWKECIYESGDVYLDRKSWMPTQWETECWSPAWYIGILTTILLRFTFKWCTYKLVQPGSFPDIICNNSSTHSRSNVQKRNRSRTQDLSRVRRTWWPLHYETIFMVSFYTSSLTSIHLQW